MRRCGVLLVIMALMALAGTWGCATMGNGWPARPSGRVIHGTIDAPASARAKGAKSVALTEAVVYVEPASGTAAAPSPARGGAASGPHAAPPPIVSTLHNQFVPGVLAVTVGTTVEFQNRDRVYHNTFSVSPARRFDVGRYGPGQKRTVTFDHPGVVNLFCELHPTSAGFIIVVPNETFVHAGPSGDFTLPPLPPGTYVVRAWHPRFGERMTRVQLTAANDATVRLRF